MRDVVAASVAAYTPHVRAYQVANAGKVADAVARVVGLVPSGARVLDAGCGPGRDLARFASAGLRPVGVDANRAFAGLAGRAGVVAVGDLRALPFPAGVFDGVWACASLVHMPPPELLIALLELVRVARVGAPVYVGVKSAGSGPAGWRDTPHGRRWFQVWSAEDLVGLAVAAGVRPAVVESSGDWVDLWGDA